mmetsp:Transcript_19199/g.35096  ORF Transcript_19199/g.35096 Transcript_19199/m.35096 type:complete len:158 (+) Transcript_19199:810-1283(+)
MCEIYSGSNVHDEVHLDKTFNPALDLAAALTMQLSHSTVMESAAFKYTTVLKEDFSISDLDNTTTPIFDLSHIPNLTNTETDLDATKSTDVLFNHVPPKPNKPIRHQGKRRVAPLHDRTFSDVSEIGSPDKQSEGKQPMIYSEEDDDLIKVFGLNPL